MNQIFLVIHIVISLLLIILILIQPKGVGLGRTFGGGGEFYKSKRGVEKIVFYLTIFFACIFFLSSLVVFLFS